MAVMWTITDSEQYVCLKDMSVVQSAIEKECGGVLQVLSGWVIPTVLYAPFTSGSSYMYMSIKISRDSDTCTVG